MALKTYEQSGVIPYRYRDGDLQVLLVTSRTGKRWGIPKGLVEAHLSSLESARQEALEEAGIEGIIDTTVIGFYEYDKWAGVCRVQVFPMLVELQHPTWLEDFRLRSWYSLTEAKIVVSNNGLRRLFGPFSDFLKRKG